MGQNISVTPKQLDVMIEVEKFQRSQCYSATIGELAASLNISRATAFEHIAGLREKGLLAQSTGRARSLKLSGKGEKLLKQARQFENKPFADTPEQFHNHSSGIQLRGRVCAGYGIEAIEEHQPFSLGEVFGNRNDLFALKVCGQSMIDAGIHDSDYVICRSAQTATDGQIVIALLDDDNATVKRFYKDPKAARLMPANDAFEPIYSDTCKIQAVVIGVVRQL